MHLIYTVDAKYKYIFLLFSWDSKTSSKESLQRIMTWFYMTSVLQSYIYSHIHTHLHTHTHIYIYKCDKIISKKWSNAD